MNVVHFPSCTTAQRVGDVINSLYGSEPAHHSCPGGQEEHPVPMGNKQAGALEALFKFS